jgi:hypothetical protein
LKEFCWDILVASLSCDPLMRGRLPSSRTTAQAKAFNLRCV